MTSLITWTCVVAYLVGAAVFARGRLRHWWNTSDLFGRNSSIDDGDRGALALAAIGAGLIWPLSLVFLRLRDWIWAPVDRDEERIERLRNDLGDWQRRARNASSADEQRMAQDIASTLQDILKRS